jgi:hypothetical protein
MCLKTTLEIALLLKYLLVYSSVFTTNPYQLHEIEQAKICTPINFNKSNYPNLSEPHLSQHFVKICKN